MNQVEKDNKKDELNRKLMGLRKKYGSEIIKTAAELEAEIKIKSRGLDS